MNVTKVQSNDIKAINAALVSVQNALNELAERISALETKAGK